MKKEEDEGGVLVSQFIIHEKRSKEHLTPPARHRGPINDKDDDVSMTNFAPGFQSMLFNCVNTFFE